MFRVYGGGGTANGDKLDEVPQLPRGQENPPLFLYCPGIAQTRVDHTERVLPVPFSSYRPCWGYGNENYFFLAPAIDSTLE